jgi:hypothetical protein
LVSRGNWLLQNQFIVHCASWFTFHVLNSFFFIVENSYQYLFT